MTNLIDKNEVHPILKQSISHSVVVLCNNQTEWSSSTEKVSIYHIWCIFDIIALFLVEWNAATACNGEKSHMSSLSIHISRGFLILSQVVVVNNHNIYYS